MLRNACEVAGPVDSAALRPGPGPHRRLHLHLRPPDGGRRAAPRPHRLPAGLKRRQQFRRRRRSHRRYRRNRAWHPGRQHAGASSSSARQPWLFALLLAAGRRLVEGDRYARGPNFLHYDPSYMLGREIHGATLGIVGLGRIGEQVARRACRAFDMTLRAVLQSHGARPARRGGIARGAATSRATNCWPPPITSCSPMPLTAETHRLIGGAELAAR